MSSAVPELNTHPNLSMEKKQTKIRERCLEKIVMLKATQATNTVEEPPSNIVSVETDFFSHCY